MERNYNGIDFFKYNNLLFAHFTKNAKKYIINNNYNRVLEERPPPSPTQPDQITALFGYSIDTFG